MAKSKCHFNSIRGNSFYSAVVYRCKNMYQLILTQGLLKSIFLTHFSSLLRLLRCSHRFLGTLKQHTIQCSVQGEDDLNVEHLQLLLLLFHNLSERGRRSVLTQVTQAITEVAQSKDSQLKAVPLNLARLCLVFDYLLRHYSKPPLYLFEQVNLIFDSLLSSYWLHILIIQQNNLFW